MMDHGRIVIDAYGHGIRDFPSILPQALSTELHVHDIVYYFRQNDYVTLYDLVGT